MRGRTYSLHSHSRGRLQHEHAHGLSRDGLMELAGLSSPEVLNRYLDKRRHLYPVTLTLDSVPGHTILMLVFA
jgi:hypothetical protein